MAAISRVTAIILTTMMLVLTWLPANRVVLDRTGYEWGLPFLNMEIGGSTLNLDWAIVVIWSLTGLVALWGFARSSKHAGAAGLVFYGLWAATALILAFVSPEGTELHGDTMEFSLNIGTVLVIISGLGFLVTLVFLFQPEASPAVWSHINTILLGVVLLLYGVAVWTLRQGEMTSALDKTGVTALLSALALLPIVFLKWGRTEDSVSQTRIPEPAP